MLRRLPVCAPLLVVIALSACAKGDKQADSVRTDTAASATPSTAAPTPAPAPALALSDANILAMLDNANMGDSASGAIAAEKATSPEVKSFARDMMRDHHMLRKDGQALTQKLALTPALPANDTSAAGAQRWQDSLNGMAKGPAFDKAYIAGEVAIHQAVLETAQSARDAAQSQDLKDLITKAAPVVQKHLDHAKAIQSKQP